MFSYFFYVIDERNDTCSDCNIINTYIMLLYWYLCHTLEREADSDFIQVRMGC